MQILKVASKVRFRPSELRPARAYPNPRRCFERSRSTRSIAGVPSQCAPRKIGRWALAEVGEDQIGVADVTGEAAIFLRLIELRGGDDRQRVFLALDDLGLQRRMDLVEVDRRRSGAQRLERARIAAAGLPRPTALEAAARLQPCGVRLGGAPNGSREIARSRWRRPRRPEQ